MRVDLENRIQSLKEELAFQTEVHKQVCNYVYNAACFVLIIFVTVQYYSWRPAPPSL